jgi:PAS domain S-box-containing protein
MSDLLKILLIDDNPDDRMLIIRELNKLFVIDVEEVIDIQGFESAIERLDFDIVITDYQLRWTNGIEVLIKIKKLSPLLPVIMFTATGSEEIAVLAMKIGLDDYILKSPQHYIRLAMAVNSAISRMHEELKRKQAENALMKSEENYRTLVENISIGFTRIDKDYKIIMVNKAQGKMFRRPVEDFVGMNCFDLYKNQSTSCPCLKSSFSPDIPMPSMETITQGIRDDKSLFDVKIRTFPTYGNDGNVTGFIEITEDLTGHIKNERIKEFIIKMTGVFHETGKPDDIIPILRAELSAILDISSLQIVLTDKSVSNNFVGFSEKLLESPVNLFTEKSLESLVIESGKALIFKKIEIDEMIRSGKILLSNPDLHAWAGAPLKSKNAIVGALVLQNADNEDALTVSELDMLQLVSNLIGIAIAINLPSGEHASAN